MRILIYLSIGLLINFCAWADEYTRSGLKIDPYQFQVSHELKQLSHKNPTVRAGAIEKLSFLRAYSVSDQIIPHLKDPAPSVRREAAMNLGWTGNASALKPLATALDDSDWTVRQAASIALENLTAQTYSFDGLAHKGVQTTQANIWKKWVNAYSPKTFALETAKQLTSDLPILTTQEDLLRSIGAFNLKQNSPIVIRLIQPYVQTAVKDTKNKALFYTPEGPSIENRAEKQMVQSGIRTLGRLGTPECRKLLVELLQNEQWAVYAAEALGDCGGELEAAALIALFPDYNTNFKRASHRTKSKGFVKRQHESDAPYLSSIDRIPRTAHMMLMALCRIDFRTEENLNALRDMSPNLLSYMPNNYDGTVVYEKEPYQMMCGYLLEKAGVRNYAIDAALEALGSSTRRVPDPFEHRAIFRKLAGDWIDTGRSQDPPFAGTILMSCCTSKDDVPELIKLLDHENGWIRIEASKTLLFLEAQEAIAPIMNLLSSAKDDADYGFSADYSRFQSKERGQGFDEYNDPSPRFKEAYIMALGKLKAQQAVPLLSNLLANERNVIEIQYAAALALGEIGTPEALNSLQQATTKHPVKIVQVLSRELIWQHKIEPLEAISAPKTTTLKQHLIPKGLPKKLVFIKGEHDTQHQFQISKDFTGYSTTDTGPVWRMGKNIYTLDTDNPTRTLRPLTAFNDGYVADLEVSYDGNVLLFSRRGPDSDPWWHVYSINADGSNLKKLTQGPYHNVHPNFMPDGRIICSSSRMGTRDEYHGYPAPGLSVMNADGSDFHVIGFNLGLDADPVVADHGKILFTRLELFYSRVKTEWNLLSVMPDGTNPLTLYGPERREFWKGIPGATPMAPPRHRIVRPNQPQMWNNQQMLINSTYGPMLTGPGPYIEKILRPDHTWAVTTPYKISENTLLVAAGKRPKKGSKIDFNAAVDHGLHYMDVTTGKLTLIYNDPETSDFEARPLQPHKIPPVLPSKSVTRSTKFTAQVLCNSVFDSQHRFAKEHGRYIRIVEGLPTIQRHQTHQNQGIAWRNHGGATGRVLGTVPLASDGSFALEVPADHLFHLQVLDSDKRVMANELIWQYARPGENKSCVGCHQKPGTSPATHRSYPAAHRMPPIPCLPYGNEIRYRGKVWFKGWVADEREERMRTVNAVNVMGRQ